MHDQLVSVAGTDRSQACTGLLFDWLYPAHFPLLLRCLEAWADEPAVTTALLKLFAELVLNRSQRLVFDSSSPNGILLFREVSKVSSRHQSTGQLEWVGQMEMSCCSCMLHVWVKTRFC